jgi:hypothetical protein
VPEYVFVAHCLPYSQTGDGLLGWSTIGLCAKPKSKGGDSGSSVKQGSAAFMQFPLNWPACTLKIVRAHGKSIS